MSHHSLTTKRRFLALQEQVRRLPGLPLTEVFSVKDAQQIALDVGLKYRLRLFSPWLTLCAFLWQVLEGGRSCREAVMHLLADRCWQKNNKAISARTGAYCQARLRLSWEFILGVVRRIAQHISQATDESNLWCARRVKIVDGTTLSMPDSAANQARYPQQNRQKPGLGFPILRMVGVFCWSSGAILDFALGPYQGARSSELALLRKMLDQFSRGDVILADCYYASYLIIALLQAQGCDIVSRQHPRRKTDFRRGQRLGKNDHIVTWHKPKRPAWLDQAHYAKLPATLQIRELRRGQLIVITTLLDTAPYTKESLVALYQTRWHCELDLRSIKQVMGMDVLRCQTPDMVEKEIAVHVLAYNLIRALMQKAAQHAQQPPRTVSFAATVQLLMSHRALLWYCEIHEEQSQAILMILADQRVGDRPGRCEPRAIKRRPKAQPLLTRPRQQARDDILAKRAG